MLEDFEDSQLLANVWKIWKIRNYLRMFGRFATTCECLEDFEDSQLLVNVWKIWKILNYLRMLKIRHLSTPRDTFLVPLKKH